jgi:UrcA family protein
MSPTKRHSGTLAGLTLLSAAALSTTSALASTPSPPMSLAVSYVRADLARPSYVEALYKRIKFAARSVCREYEGYDLVRLANHRHCYETAVDTAVAQVAATSLTALHRSRRT